MAEYWKLRPDVIVKYIEQHRFDCTRRFETISERDKLLIELNNKYGFLHADGKPTIGKMNNNDSAYLDEYNRIDQKYSDLYEAISEQRNEIKQETITIYEYLLLEDSSDVHTQLLEAAQKDDSWMLDFVRLKASAQIDKWKSAHTVGELRRLVVFKGSILHYAGARCMRFFKISFFDVPKRLAIMRFHASYKNELKRAFDALIIY